jgi:hypothetical protein
LGGEQQLADAVQRIALAAPVAEGGLLHAAADPVGHHLQQPAALKIDQAGDPPGRCHAGRLEEARLVQAEGRHALQASSVVHQRGAVVVHGAHHGRPANPKVTSDRGVDGSEQLLALPGGGHLTTRIPGGKAGP